jgi:Four helix bundle sensory module for signal transduction
MKKVFFSNRGIAGLQAGLFISLVLLIFFIAFFFISRQNVNRLKTEYEKSIEKTHLVQTMKSELLASAEAEKSSVMADTDEASKAFAEQSMQASQNVEKARIAFKPLIEKNSAEAQRFDDFSACWNSLGKMDKKILSLAVQNTNVKAMRLSFGTAAVAIRNMEGAMNKLMDRAATAHPDEAGTVRLASKALMDALEIYALEAPHIAETTDAGMDGIEANMKQLDERVRDALSRLDATVGGAGKRLLDQAWKFYREFQTVNAKIIGLSRRNTNIRSFEESLGQERHTMALCLDRLNAIQEAVQENATFKATR